MKKKYPAPGSAIAAIKKQIQDEANVEEAKRLVKARKVEAKRQAVVSLLTKANNANIKNGHYKAT
jgi:hypothetical protein